MRCRVSEKNLLLFSSGDMLNIDVRRPMHFQKQDRRINFDQFSNSVLNPTSWLETLITSAS